MGKQKPKTADVYLSQVETPHAIAKTPWARAWLVVGRHRLCVPGPLIDRVTEIAKASKRKLADELADTIQDGLTARGEWPRSQDIALIEGAITARCEERVEQAKADQERRTNDKQMAGRLHLGTYRRAIDHYTTEPGVLSAPRFRALIGLAEAAGVKYPEILADLGRDPNKADVAAFLRVFIERNAGTPAAAAFAAMLDPEPVGV